jgi:enoyl-CoA hydratase/carnithine racemase
MAEKCSPTSMAIMKRQVYQDLTETLAHANKDSFDRMIESFSRPDFKEGVQAFLEKRPPQFARVTSKS